MTDDIRGRAFEFARKNADNWSADDIDNLASLLASERAAAEDREQARTQNEIVATLAALVGPDNVASGDGCDSGDALDWTVACVSLTIRKILDRHEEALLAERAAALGAVDREMKKKPFKIGDRVTTGFDPYARDVVRRVTSVLRIAGYESGWAVSADGGEVCSACGRRGGVPLKNLDSTWFKLARRVK
jgi:hypothetical protein